MATRKISRVAVGGMVRVDVDGLGNFVYGKVSFYDAKTGNVIIDPSDGSKEVETKKDLLEKATAAELKAFAKGKTDADDKPKAKRPTRGEKKDRRKTPGRRDEDLEEGEEEDDEEALQGMPGALAKARRERYVTATLPNKHQTAHNDDKVARELHGKDLEEVKKYVAGKHAKDKDTAKELGLCTTAGQFTSKYGHLNRGHQRMLIGIQYRKYLSHLGKL